MVNVIEFDLDRELGFDPDREFDFDPNNGLDFDSDRPLSFDASRPLPFGVRGVLFRGIPCPRCGYENHHNEEFCQGCDIRLQSELKLDYVPSRTMKEIEWEAMEVRQQTRQKSREQARALGEPTTAREPPPAQQRGAPRSKRPSRPQASFASPGQIGQQKARSTADRCAACGVRVSPRHPYCWNCGAPIQPDPGPKKSARPHPRNLRQGNRSGLFPVIFRCSGCRAKIRVKEPGKFSCPACDTMTRVDSRGYTRPVEEIRKSR